MRIVGGGGGGVKEEIWGHSEEMRLFNFIFSHLFFPSSSPPQDENGSLCELPGLENGECPHAMQGAARRGGLPHCHTLCSLPHRLPPAPKTPSEWGWTPLTPQGPVRQP